MSERVRTAAVAALTIVAAALRIPLLSRPMGNDEAASFIYYASHPLSVIVTIYGSPNNHILHTILMHTSYLIFGGAEWALRLPALLAGIALVPLTYTAARAMDRPSSAAEPALSAAEGRHLLPREKALRPTEPSPSGEGGPKGRVRGALICAAFAASAPILIDYSTDARGYTLLCCFVLICVIAIQRSAWRTFAISAALGFYTVPVMLYPFLLLVVWSATLRPRLSSDAERSHPGWSPDRQAIIAAVEAVVIAAALYAPALLISGVAAIASNPYVRPVPNFFGSLLPYLEAVREQLLVGIPIVIQLLLLAAFLWSLRSAAPWRRLWLGLPIVALTIMIQRVLPFPRVWLPFLILAFMTAAAAWPWRPSEPAVAAAIVIALAITGFTTPRVRETGELRAVREITRDLNRIAQPGDPVLALQPSEMPLAFYCRRVEALNPDVSRPRLFVVENRDYGRSAATTLAFFKIDPRRYAIRKLRDYGSAALYELRRLE